MPSSSQGALHVTTLILVPKPTSSPGSSHCFTSTQSMLESTSEPGSTYKPSSRYVIPLLNPILVPKITSMPSSSQGTPRVKTLLNPILVPKPTFGPRHSHGFTSTSSALDLTSALESTFMPSSSQGTRNVITLLNRY